ncbi:hypothetical protein MCOR02_012168 [Pyricularia oryzae]|nr:hypothetical protein MCOR02_012168 [Pyricularia oryzae]KAI6479547.1 hypothetical protein MCOR13_011429 [Pyricularia oryzae]KAI6616246.1 hypothetical protein MCOR14_011047 [Pyricularia oryzae]
MGEDLEKTTENLTDDEIKERDSDYGELSWQDLQGHHVLKPPDNTVAIVVDHPDSGRIDVFEEGAVKPIYIVGATDGQNLVFIKWQKGWSYLSRGNIRVGYIEKKR